MDKAFEGGPKEKVRGACLLTLSIVISNSAAGSEGDLLPSA